MPSTLTQHGTRSFESFKHNNIVYIRVERNKWLVNDIDGFKPANNATTEELEKLRELLVN